MACNCVTGKQLDELYRKIGHRIEPTTGEKVKFNFKNVLTSIGIYLCLIPITIYMIFYIIYKYFKGNGRINIYEFFGLKNYIDDDGIKQIIPNKD